MLRPLPMDPGNLSRRECLTIVGQEIQRFAKPQRGAADLDLSAVLSEDLGLSSQALVELATALEHRMGMSSGEVLPVTELRTVGDLLDACWLRTQPKQPNLDPALDASIKRGQLRRRSK